VADIKNWAVLDAIAISALKFVFRFAFDFKCKWIFF